MFLPGGIVAGVARLGGLRRPAPIPVPVPKPEVEKESA